jgi:hypothetical protein
MQTIDSLKEEYNKNLALSKIELGAITDKAVRISAEGTVNAAKRKLADTRSRLMRAIMNGSTTVFVSVEQSVSGLISEISEKNVNVAEVDFLSLEKTVMDIVFNQARARGFSFNSTAVTRINNAIFELREVIGASFIAPVSLRANQYRTCQNEEEALAYMQKILQSTFSNELKTLFLSKQMNTHIERRLESADSFVFFVTNMNTNSDAFSGITGKTVTITLEDGAVESTSDLQKLVSSKLKKTTKPNKLTKE